MVALPTVFIAVRQIHTLAFTTCLCILAFVPTHPAVQSIRRHIDAFLIAAIGPSAPFSVTNPRVLIASNRGLRLPLSEKAAHAPTNIGLELGQRNLVGGGRQLFKAAMDATVRFVAKDMNIATMVKMCVIFMV